MVKCLFMLFGFLLAPFTLLGMQDDHIFKDPEQKQHYETLLKELRCVTCPNQNIADSHAPVAQAMQEEIYRRLNEGETPEEVKNYLLSRYGDYVLYRPLLKQSTWLLWAGPIIMLFTGLLIWLKVFYFRRPR